MAVKLKSHFHRQPGVQVLHTLPPQQPHSKLLTIYDDLNIFEVDLPASQDPPLTAVRPFVCFLDSPDLQVVVGQDYKSN